ncbi:hypothetical protein BJ741DRAFT_600816 [Chytriomyces cf. hyalinus JEL632]|nr:hypothetical protein BJ741DRAFT_600816 [Chytriomyces cf. hyalinus JEL632]
MRCVSFSLICLLVRTFNFQGLHKPCPNSTARVDSRRSCFVTWTMTVSVFLIDTALSLSPPAQANAEGSPPNYIDVMCNLAYVKSH